MKSAVLLFFTAAIILCAGCSKTESNAILLTRAADAAEQADWTSALSFARKAVDQNPMDANAQLMCALALENTAANGNEVLDCASKAVEIDPGSFMAQYTLGRLFFRREKYDRAVAPLKEARKLRPADRNTLILLAQSLAHQNHSEALGYYKLLAKMKPCDKDPALWNELAMIFLIRKQPGTALSFFKRAEQYAPRDPNIAANLAVINDFYLANKHEAASYYTRFMQLTAQRPDLAAKRMQVAVRLRYLQD